MFVLKRDYRRAKRPQYIKMDDKWSSVIGQLDVRSTMILSVTFSVNIKCYGWFNVKVLNDDVEHIHVLHQLIFVEFFLYICNTTVLFFLGGGSVELKLVSWLTNVIICNLAI